MAKPADPRKKTLLDPDMMGGIVGGKGFDFQTRYAACQLVRWLGEGLEQLLMEGVGDVDVRFANGERHLFQVKDHEVKAGEFREVLDQFLEIDGSDLGVYQRYVLVCTGLVSTLRPLENGLARYRGAKPFYEDVPEALAPTRAALEERLPGFDFGFVEGKVHFDVGHGDLHRDEHARALFGGLLSGRGRSVRSVYDEVLTLLSARKGKVIERRELEELLRVEEEAPVVDLSPTVPPANTVDRPGMLGELREAVLAGRGGHIGLTAVEGMGGIGKTVLAQMLCEDAAIRAAFPDGVFWFTVGRESTVAPGWRARQVARACGGKELAFREAVRDKAILVVLDDVWSEAPVEELRAVSGRSAVLFTTREKQVAARLGARSVTVQLLEPEESRMVLGKAAGLENGRLPEAAGEIIGECNGHALALAMLGAALRGRPVRRWDTALNRLRKAPDVIPQVFAISMEALENAGLRERYVGLAVMLEDMRISLPVMRTLWQVSAEEAARIADVFVDHSLATRPDLEQEAITLHDLQFDFIRVGWDAEVLGLIHGAVRLSLHVVEGDGQQFASQVHGRLLGYQDVPGVRKFLEGIAAGAPRPWIRCVHAVLHPPGTGLVRTLELEIWPVSAVALTPDGKRAVSACLDGTLKVRDLESGRVVRTLEGHSGGVNKVAVTADGKRAVSASWDQTLKMWDLESGRVVRTLEGHSGGVRGVAVTADGKRAVSAAEDKTLKVWDLESGRVLRTLEGHSDGVRGVAVTADGKRAVSACEDKTLKVWDLESGSVIRTLEGHSDGVKGVEVTADGRRAVSACEDKTLKVWDLESGSVISTLEGHSDGVTGVAVTLDGKRAVSASWDQTLKVWDLETGNVVRTLEGHAAVVNGVAVTADGKRAVSASLDETLKMWDLESGCVMKTHEGHSDGVTAVAVTADGKRAVSASWDATLNVWDLEIGRVLRTLEGHPSSVNGVAVTVDGKRAVSASRDHTLKVWDLEGGRVIWPLAGHSDWVNGVAVTVDCKRAVSASSDETLKVWDLESGWEVRTLEGHGRRVAGVALTRDGTRAVSASLDKTLKVWDMESGRLVRTLAGHSGGVIGVAVTVDGKIAVSASYDRTLKVWDLEGGREVRTLEGHSEAVFGVGVNGQRAVSASWDKTLKVWDLETGRNVATFSCDAHARCCAWIDAHRIIAGDRGGRVYFLYLEE